MIVIRRRYQKLCVNEIRNTKVATILWGATAQKTNTEQRNRNEATATKSDEREGYLRPVMMRAL